jgi:hypothetical protein
MRKEEVKWIEQEDQLKGGKRKRGLDLGKGNNRLHESYFQED